MYINTKQKKPPSHDNSQTRNTSKNNMNLQAYKSGVKKDLQPERSRHHSDYIVSTFRIHVPKICVTRQTLDQGARPF